MIKHTSWWYSSNELKKFKRIKRYYMTEYNYPAWKAEQYAYDHVIMDRKATV